jgi:hypothetical protein
MVSQPIEVSSWYSHELKEYLWCSTFDELKLALKLFSQQGRLTHKHCRRKHGEFENVDPFATASSSILPLQVQKRSTPWLITVCTLGGLSHIPGCCIPG